MAQYFSIGTEPPTHSFMGLSAPNPECIFDCIDYYGIAFGFWSFSKRT